MSAFDDDKFINLDLNTCNVCADGCDDWVYVKTTDIAHHIRFSRNDERLDEIRNFIDLLFDLKTEYAEN